VKQSWKFQAQQLCHDTTWAYSRALSLAANLTTSYDDMTATSVTRTDQYKGIKLRSRIAE
jgi:hypothetical protein